MAGPARRSRGAAAAGRSGAALHSGRRLGPTGRGGGGERREPAQVRPRRDRGPVVAGIPGVSGYTGDPGSRRPGTPGVSGVRPGPVPASPWPNRPRLRRLKESRPGL